ncbi:hypothetical protein QFC22_006417 [Naganishia vaughanmartiniae]|uniref:Uncharacterized protein n=1 Tax=Naganishia vaughanmartiniae TaxID=1424756 RepID=A0ACC2WJ36_9TREE|nr:hypothetical protein QFC22_006417 [Naganishia vaughanmartiniae]
MPCIVKTVLQERFPDGLPAWCPPLLKGIHQLDNVNSREDKADGGEEDGVIEEVEKERAASSCSSLSDISDEYSESEECGSDAEEDQNMEEEDPEEEDGEQTPELNFRKAILLSDKEPLPYIWLAYVQMESEEWPQARQSLQQALDLAPFTTPLLFRLSTCFERERNYIEAHKVMECAIKLTPHDQRDFYELHFARLAERAKDMKENTYREDPFEMLPLEVVLNIMEIGLELDDNFVLRSSWVCQGWRRILIQNSPELWQGLAITSRDVTENVAQSKKQTWLARSKEKLTSLSFREFNCTNADKLPVAFMKQMDGVKHLSISCSERNVLSYFSWKLDGRIGNLESLRLTGGATKTGKGRGQRWQPNQLKDICFSFAKKDARDDLHTIEVHNLELGTNHWYNTLVDDRYCAQTAKTRTRVLYPRLKRLSVRACSIDNGYDAELFSNDHGTSVLKYQCDPVHTTLRGSPALEYLEATVRWKGGSYSALHTHPAGPDLGRRITLSNLQTAIVPPPSLWCVDILAPTLKSLTYKTPAGFDFKTYNQLSDNQQKPLIPEVIHSPMRLETLPNLQELELVCYERDSELRLEKWMQHLASLTKLTIRSLGGDPWPKVSDTSSIPDQRAAVNVVRMLTEHLEWCPILREIELERCFATGSSLIELVRTRKRSSICVNLEGLTLSRNLTLTKNAVTVLRKELSHFQQGAKLEPKVVKRVPKEYKKDSFKK